MLDFEPVAALVNAARTLHSETSHELRRLLPGFAALETALADLDQAQREQTESHDAIEAAREQYASEDIEIDPSPAVSVADDGTWIAAWLWVPASK